MYIIALFHSFTYTVSKQILLLTLLYVVKVFKKHPCIIITNIHTFKTTIAHKTIPFEIGVSIFFVTDRNVKK